MSWMQMFRFRLQVFSLIAAIGCPIGLAIMAGQLSQQLASNSWPSVSGRIDGVVARTWWDKKNHRMKYFGRAVYSYVIDGQSYKSDLTDLGPGIKRLEPNAALYDVRKYREGMRVDVYYDPKNPSTAVISPGIPATYQLLLVVLVVGTIGGVIGSYFTLRAWLSGDKGESHRTARQEITFGSSS